MFIWMDEREERLSDKEVRLLVKMAREHGVEVDKVKTRVEESPVCKHERKSKKVVFKRASRERWSRSVNDRQEMTYSSEFPRLSVTRPVNDRRAERRAGVAGWASGAEANA